MNYAERERNPARHLPSISMVIGLHLLLGYALVTGLARKVVEVIKAPIETKIIEEIKKPPPDTPPPPPPKLAAPPPPFIPPPEINIQVPVVQQPTISTVTTERPPPGPPPVAAPTTSTQPAVRRNFSPVSREISAAAFTANSRCVLTPVPTAVPPSASSARCGSVDST